MATRKAKKKEMKSGDKFHITDKMLLSSISKQHEVISGAETMTQTLARLIGQARTQMFKDVEEVYPELADYEYGLRTVKESGESVAEIKHKKI